MSDTSGKLERPPLRKRIRAWLEHAFSLEPPEGALTEEDFRLLDRVANEVVRRRMVAPAIFFLEAGRPFNFLGSQAIVFFRPILTLLLSEKGVDRVIRILEVRGSIEVLIRKIEERAASPSEPVPRAFAEAKSRESFPP